MARFRRTTTKGNTYLQFVQSFRNEKKQPATRVLANLGNISNLPQEKIELLTKSFIKAMGVEDKFQMNSFLAGKGYHYGTCLPAIAIWHQLGLDRIITNALPKKLKIPVSKISLIQTANRFSDPGSKLACYRWHSLSLFFQLKNFVHFPEGDDKEKLHSYYRSLDYLCSAKEKIEQELYYYFKSYGMDNRLVLYDITSVYFEGSDSQIGENGHSRDRRPDADQIVIGLVMSRDGIPIAHHVFEGNRLDKTTVEEVMEDLQKRFSIKEIVFVGDRGMLTVENIESVKVRGNNYILGMQKRNRLIIKYLMKKIDKRVEFQQFTYADLSEEFKKKYSEGVRFVVCYNSSMAHLNKLTREKNIGRFEELANNVNRKGELDTIKESHYKLKSYLSKYHMTKFYELKLEKDEEKSPKATEPFVPLEKEGIYKLHVEKRDAAIAEEASLDGRYFIQTEVDGAEFNMEEVVSSYKSLQKVEQAFRVIKNVLDIRPVYVRLETRIRGHVMICYFSLLINILLEKKMRELFPDMEDAQTRKASLKKSQRSEDDSLTMKTLREELDTIRLIPLYINGNENPQYISTKIGNNVKKLFSSLGIRNAMNPEKLRIADDKQNTDQNQLELYFGE